MNLMLANPRGFCAGVDRAIAIVNRALDLFPAPIYVRHEVVHNRFVVDGLRQRGAVFVEELNEIPDDSVVIFSAHGVSQAVRAEAETRGLKVFDATCPLVTKVHMEVHKYSRDGRDCVLIGHAGHPEVEGTMGQFDERYGGKMHLVETLADVQQLQLQTTKAAFVSQTTLSVDDTKEIIDALRLKYPAIVGPRKDDICYATQNRQDAVRELAVKSDVIIVVGSENSSNSNRLRELAQRMGVSAYLVDNAGDVKSAWLEGKTNIGVSAGASAPEALVASVCARLQDFGVVQQVELEGEVEELVFSLPRELH